MNSGPTPPRPDDEARDPLLTALQQRLHDYGQAPPPGAWAAIRQQLPPALPRPWWRRPRRLLPLLGLLLGLLAVGTLLMQPAYLQHDSQAISRRKPTLRSNSKQFPTTPNPTYSSNQQSAVTNTPTPASELPPAAGAPVPSPTSAAGAVTIAEVTQATTRTSNLPRTITRASSLPRTITRVHNSTSSSGSNLGGARAAASAKAASATRADASLSSPHQSTIAPSLSATQRTQHRRRASLATADAQQPKRQAVRRVQRGSLGAFSPQKNTLATTAASSHEYSTTSPHLRAKRSQRRVRRTMVTLSPAGRRQMGLTSATPAARAKYGQPATEYTAVDELPAPSGQLPALDSLTLKPVALGLAPGLLSPTLVARPDSFQHMPRPRRWSLLVLAGPTLSYRTLGSAPTLAAQHPDFARLERPALGFGAQVQVRRVLSGRWALALGLGYHEYATQLALSIIDSSSRSPRSVHQRDVYRVLTLPVQFSYALGAPRGRLAWGLLFGAEPSWYRGGRSTEGSDCGCQQQSYPLDSARTGPYRSLSLALSLGLDLRYRLGGPASRWQWVVQPTARYVVTPFVRSEAVGFTRRQPWSLGLLTGISWDIR